MSDDLTRRVAAGRLAAEAAGAALGALRGSIVQGTEASGGQYKTVADEAAEAWVVAFLRNTFPGEPVLAEEEFERRTTPWHPPAAYWTVDALDGTRSFIEGFDGFCVQLAWVVGQRPVVGVIHEPALGTTFWGSLGGGAFRSRRGERPVRLSLDQPVEWPASPVFVDSRPPAGPVGQVLAMRSGEFLECGAVGCKVARILEGQAQVYAKDFCYKLWDVAPGDAILAEAGGRLGTWGGSAIPYATSQVTFRRLLASPESLFDLIVSDLGPLDHATEP